MDKSSLVYDSITVGGGPGGSTLGYRLAQDDMRTPVPEKSIFPRVKPCGGALDGAFRAHLPLEMSVDDVVEGEVRYVGVTRNGRANVRRHEVQGKIQLTQRYRLDLHLLAQAEEAGVVVRQGTQVDRIERNGDIWEVGAGGGAYRTKAFISADGAYSTVARTLGMQGRRSPFVAAEWDLHPTEAETLLAWSDTALVDISTVPFGYYWIFPKADHFNVGWGAPKRYSARGTPMVFIRW